MQHKGGGDPVNRVCLQVVLGSQQLKTLTFRQTLNPSYYEAMEMEVILPEMMQLAPDIVVGFLEPKLRLFAFVAFACYCTLKECIHAQC